MQTVNSSGTGRDRHCEEEVLELQEMDESYLEGSCAGDGGAVPELMAASTVDDKIEVDNGIYEGMDEDLNTSSISAGDLYDDTVMGLLSLDDEFDEGGSSQKSRTGSHEMFEARGIASSEKPSNANFKEGRPCSGGKSGEEDEGFRSLSPSNGNYNGKSQRRFAVYVGNLTWWTTHEDIKKALKLVGVLDVLDVKIYECRANGQSKGYCLVTFASDASINLVSENLGKMKINGRSPTVKPDSKLSVSYFESQTKTRPPTSASMQQVQQPAEQFPGVGSRIYQVSSMGMANRFGVRQFQRNFGHRGGMSQGPRTWGPMCGPNNGNVNQRYAPRIPHNMFGMSPRGLPPPMSYGPVHYDDWRNPPSSYVPRVHFNPAFLNRLPMLQELDYPPPLALPGEDISYNSYFRPEYSTISTSASDGMNATATGSQEPERGIPSSASPPSAESPILPSSSFTISVSSVSDGKRSSSAINELDTQELLDRNNSICSQAIQRAVNDASSGEYASAIETLVTAISLIRGSKVCKEKRCQVLICSLQDTLEGIEHRSYGRQKAARSSGDMKDKPHSSYRRSRSPKSRDNSSSRNYYDREGKSSSQYVQSKDRIRRRTWEERDRGYGTQPDTVARDPQAKLSRLDGGKDSYRR